MKMKDQFRFIIQNMKKNKVRVFMTVLATAMGCAFLIVLASVAFGLHDTVLKDTMESGEITQIQVHGYEESETSYRPINDQDIKLFEDLEGVSAVTRQKSVRQDVTFSTEGYEVPAPAISAHFPSEEKSGLELAEGRLPEKPNEVVVGHHFASSLIPEGQSAEELYDEQGLVKEEFRYDENIIGKPFDLNLKKIADGKESSGNFDVTIVGVMEAPAREWEWDQNVYLTADLLSELESFTGTPNAELYNPSEVEVTDTSEASYDNVIVYAANVEAVKAVSEKLKEEKYATYSVVNEMKQLNMLFNVAKAGLIFIGTIAILIASIGIYNTMTMAVTERAPDIGIMKAIGASPKVIKRIFLLESSYIGLIGAAIGIAAAYAISVAVNLALPMILEAVFDEKLPTGLRFSSIPFSLILIAVIICLTVTILSGLRPAKRATEIDVLKAMRREI